MMSSDSPIEAWSAPSLAASPIRLISTLSSSVKPSAAEGSTRLGTSRKAVLKAAPNSSAFLAAFFCAVAKPDTSSIAACLASPSSVAMLLPASFWEALSSSDI